MGPNISDEAVQSATGKTWPEWNKALAEAGTETWTHKAIASYLRDKFLLNSWWSHQVATAFERNCGRKAAGQSDALGFQIGARMTIAVSRARAWELLNSPQGINVWLGAAGIGQVEAGQEYMTLSGVSVTVKVVNPLINIRVRWKTAGWQRPSTVQVRLIPVGHDKTTISFHQENIPDASVRAEMRVHWQKVLAQLENLLNQEP